MTDLFEQSDHRLKGAIEEVAQNIAGSILSKKSLFAIMEQLHDYDAHASDVMHLLDAYNIEKAHLMGLSQGGLLTLIIATQYPDRILSGVAAAAPLKEATSMLGFLLSIHY